MLVGPASDKNLCKNYMSSFSFIKPQNGLWKDAKIAKVHTGFKEEGGKSLSKSLGTRGKTCGTRGKACGTRGKSLSKSCGTRCKNLGSRPKNPGLRENDVRSNKQISKAKT